MRYCIIENVAGNFLPVKMNQPKVLHRGNIDKKLWDELVVRTNGSLYSTYDYLSLCEGDWEALVLIEDGKYICAAPFPYRKRVGQKYIYQSPMASYFTLMTLPSDEQVREKFVNDWLEQLKKYKYVAKYFFKDASINWLKGFEIIKHQGLQIEIHSEYEKNYYRYSKGRKENLNKAYLSNQAVKQSFDVELFCLFHEKYAALKIDGLNWAQTEWMRVLWKQLLQNDQIEIYFSESNQEILGGVLIGKFGTTIYMLATFSSSEGRKKYSVALVMDCIIKKYAQSNYTYFDLGNTAGTQGIDEFKLQFGATYYSIRQIYRNHLPWFIRIPKNVLNFFKINTGANPY